MSFSLLRGSCIRHLRVRSSPIVCPAPSRVGGKCHRLARRYGFFRRIIVHRFVKDRKCRCLRRSIRLLRLCRCDAPRVLHLCLTRTGEQLRLHDRFVSTTDRRSCHRVRSTKGRKTRCVSRWRRATVSPCHAASGLRMLLFKRQRRQNCRCVTERRRKSCRCACPKDQQRRRCRGDRAWEVTRVSFRLSDCRCLTRRTR